MGLILQNNRPNLPDLGFDAEGDTDVVERLQKPRMFRVLILNDDFTPMDFVVHVLQRFFAKDEMHATQIMLDVHKKGAGVAGVYSMEVAEMKSHQVNEFSRQNKYPLKTTVEEADHD